MFPLSTNFIESLQITLLFSICAASYSIALSIALKGKMVLTIPIIVGLIIPIIVCASFYIWMMSVTNYQPISQAIFFVGLIVLLAVSAFWVVIVNFILPFLVRLIPRLPNWKPGAIMSLFLAIFPALVLSSLAFERQTTPDTACANEGISVIMGTHAYFLRPDFNAHFHVSQTNEFDPMMLRYSTSIKHKESLKIACRISNDGTIPLPAHRLKFYPYTVFEHLKQRCTEGWHSVENICAGLAEANYQQVRSLDFTEKPELLIRTMASWFQHVDDPNVLTGGDMRDGFVCWGDESKDEQVHCKVWFPIDSKISVVADSVDLKGVGKVDLVKQIHDAVDFTLKAILQ